MKLTRLITIALLGTSLPAYGAPPSSAERYSPETQASIKDALKVPEKNTLVDPYGPDPVYLQALARYEARKKSAGWTLGIGIVMAAHGGFMLAYPYPPEARADYRVVGGGFVAGGGTLALISLILFAFNKEPKALAFMPSVTPRSIHLTARF